MGRPSQGWYCGQCGAESDWDDNKISRCSCGSFYGECCVLNCEECGDSTCPECQEGFIFECCDVYLCDTCFGSANQDGICPKCGEKSFKCPSCRKLICSNCQ